jgi:folate-binding protein YgfZ
MQPISVEQYRALGGGAGATNRSWRGRIVVTGGDRLSYLHAMLTNDIVSLRPGTGCYAAYLTPQGRMIADMHVLELGDLTLLDVEPGAKTAVLEKLEQFIFSEDVRLVDATADLGEIGVYGARAAAAILAAFQSGSGQLAKEQLDRLAEYHSVRAAFGGGTAVIAGDRELGVPGFVLYIDAGRAAALEAAIRDAGAIAVDEAVLEVLRVEAGRPRFGVDMDETTIPLEAGIEGRAISFTKGCYPGQEVIVRVVHRGHGRVARKLVGMVAAGSGVPARGDRILASDKDIGMVTSGVASVALLVPIALGYVQRDLAAAGTAVSIAHADDRLAAKVVETPFVRHDERA